MPEIKETSAQEIERLCLENSLDVKQVLRLADVESRTFQNWKKKDPESIEIKNRILAKISEMSASKSESL